MQFVDGQHIHFVGIGGFGLSAIARVLLERGFTVSGSDLRAETNPLTAALARDGAHVYPGHKAEYIDGADMLIVSSAIPVGNPEVDAAQAAGIPVYKRVDILAPLMQGKKVIAVAGTHGKTTTTAMIVHVLQQAGLSPSYIVGGVMSNTGTNAGNGTGDLFVIEADEYDYAFLGIRPDIIVLTNIEWDHPDFFKAEADLIDVFERFLDRMPYDADEGDTLIACMDSPHVARLVEQRFQRRSDDEFDIMYGLGDALYQAKNLHTTPIGGTRFDVELRAIAIATLGTAQVRLPGRHNVLNGLGALLACAAASGDAFAFDDLAHHLSTFTGTGRRFEVRADADRVAVVDDYAHHPTAIRATIGAARSRYPNRALWVVWQPHTYTRTQALWEGFRTAFDNADHVLVTDIYAAREAPLDGVTSAALVAAMTHPDACHTPSRDDAVNALRERVSAPAVILIMSAGDAPQIGIDYLAGSAS